MTPSKIYVYNHYFFPNEKLIFSLSLIFLIDNAQHKKDIHIFNSAIQMESTEVAT